MSEIKFTDEEAEMLVKLLRDEQTLRSRITIGIRKHQEDCRCAEVVGETNEKDLQARSIARAENLWQIAENAIEKVQRLS